MFGVKLTCPQCKEPITTNTSRCPSCRNTIPKKHIEHYKKAETKFWITFLGGFIIFLIIPFLLYDLLGTKWTGTLIASGIPISFLAGYLVMFMDIYGKKRKRYKDN
ncbi:MAG: hypothetical protein JG781_1568 [Peptococcaceae bacterium]|jgi:ABC-type Fe3+-siderophore transport system permease subunit|nr:hypothetical protein [Peptococcaceae bacterium]